MKAVKCNEEELKDSGIEWIGKYPKNWDIYPANGVFNEVKNKNTSLDYTNQFSFRYGEIVDKNIQGNLDDKLKDTISAYNIVMPDTIMINGLNLNYDFISQRVAIIKTPGIITSAYLALYPDKQRVCPQFAVYLFKAYDFQQVFHGMGSGIRKTLSFQNFKNIFVVAPQLDEQERIANYLDDRCSKIDAIIAEAKASIGEYQELKQAVIYEAITKGLDKSIPMKYSGNIHIKDIPLNWNLVNLKYLLTDIVDCPHETPNYEVDGSFYVIRTADEDLGFLRSDDNMYRLNEEEYKNRIRRLSLNKDDIVYGREGERWGLACLVPENDKYCLGQRMMQFRCDTKIVEPRFLMWALNSQGTRMQGVVDTIGSTSPHVNISTIRNFQIPCPSIEEQRKIAKYIDDRTFNIDSIISEKQSLIADLEAYKKSLIYEVVTGKRKVVA